ncbi:MAG: hypothetical protein ACODAE_07270 [Gemmatimonadota bacterium]
MADVLDDRYGTYRCPVCGRRELLALDRDEPHAVSECRHCGTSLIIRRRGTDSVRFTAQVSGSRGAG